MSEALTEIQKRAADAVEKMHEWASNHGDWRAASCINLIAANNVISAAARAALSSRLADKPVSGALGRRHHMGSRFIDLIETSVVELARELFRASTVEYRPMSGNLANAVAIFGIVRPGETIFLLPPGAPSHHSHRDYAALAAARVLFMPFDYQQLDVDHEVVARMARAERPRLIIVGSHLALFPYRLEPLRAIADEVGAVLLYDGAHPLGLIAGGQFQDPLAEGAHLLTASTQKSMPGPIGGLVLTNDDALGEAIRSTTGKMMSNYQNNRVLALGITLAEMLAFGRPYAATCVANARALAGALAEEGFRVFAAHKGYTRSNVLLLDVSDRGAAEPLTRTWEAANIMTTIVTLPGPSVQTGKPADGVRIGVQEMTRKGMGRGEMETIARLMGRVARGEDPAEVGREAADLAEQFRQVHYCFESPLPPSAQDR